MRLEIPESSVMEVTSLTHPADWRSDESATQAIGMRWLRSKSSLGLWVPSFVEPAENNLLLNPAHPDYPRIELVVEKNPFVFDPRLFAQLISRRSARLQAVTGPVSCLDGSSTQPRPPGLQTQTGPAFAGA